MIRACFACLLLIPVIASGDERILGYHSDILVKQDGWIEVTETIRVRAEGVQIRRGIYRDYPTRYEDRFGNDLQVLYEPRAVLRNDVSEEFRSEKRGNGLRTYFGRSDVMLDHGEHTYTYRYDAGRMLGFFDDFDELYWNVTGNGWNFPIDRASATVSFEFEVPADSYGIDAYTGSFRENGKAFNYATDERGGVTFQTTNALGIGEGLTIAVSWPKGLVDEPSDMQKLMWLLADNLNLLIALAGLAAILSYYIPVWKHFGRDPEPGVVFTRYEPPGGFSAASLRYIENMGYDDETMTAAVVSLAVKGYLRINKDDDDEHTLQRRDPGDNPPQLATGERELHDALFEDGDYVILDDKYHKLLGNARSKHEKSLSRDYKSRYFKTNGALNLPPLLIMLVSSLVALRVASGPTFFVFGTIALELVSIVVFAIIMKRPTPVGRRLLDEMSGFREYLEIAEKDEMNLRNPPDKTPVLFEQYLPFALAMGVEQQWADRFADVFASLRGPANTSYHPSWYNGSWDSLNLSSNTASLSSGLGSAISSSVTAPGSSSGSGGGGFSGGGGGGGGGGGW
jgi:uncharacterized membrane protein YgcG